MTAFIIFALTALYVGWALLYHWRRHDLHRKVVLEYLGIAAFGLIAALSVYLFL